MTETTVERLLDEARAIVDMAWEMNSRGLDAEALAFATAATQRIELAKAILAMNAANRPIRRERSP